MNPAVHLVVFVNPPRIGRAKTRLAGDIGAVAAWSFYRRMLETILPPLVRDRRWRCWLAVTPAYGFAGIRLGGDVGLVAQGPGDLGRRMARVVRVLPPGPVVIVGADAPDLAPRHVADAFRALGRADAVFGPAVDGGYWLVGLRRRPRRLDPFRNVRWSTRHALTDTLRNLDGHSHALLETLADVDDGAAYAQWRKKR